MPPPLPVGNLHDAPFVIDLTGDAQDSLLQQPAPRQKGGQAPESYPDVPFSNHGLILPGTFSNLVRRNSSASASSGSSRYASTARQNGVQTRIIPPNEKFRHLYPQVANQNNKGQRTSLGPGVIAQVVSSNPSKRRKLELFPTGLRKTASYPAILPPGTGARNAPIRPPTRIAPPRVQHNVEYKSQLAVVSRASLHSSGSTLELARTAKNHILKHVRKALASYSQTLPETEQNTIAYKVCEQILCDLNVFEHFQANNWTPEFEYQLSCQANAQVNRLVVDMQISRGASTESEIASSKVNAFPTKDAILPPRRNASRLSRMNSSEEPIEEEPVFDDLGKWEPSGTLGVRRRGYSSSPTTSVSAEIPFETLSGNKPIVKNTPTVSTAASTPEPSGQVSRALRSKRQKVASNTTQNPPANSIPRQSTASPATSIVNNDQRLRYAGSNTHLARPYLSLVDREDIQRGLDELELEGDLSPQDLSQLQRSVLHIDFSIYELRFIRAIIRAAKNISKSQPLNRNVSQEITALLQESAVKLQELNIVKIARLVRVSAEKSSHKRDHRARAQVQLRNEDSIRAFLIDAAAGNISSAPGVVQINATPSHQHLPPNPSISSLLRERETWGMAPHRVRNCKQPFHVEFASRLEDSLIPRSQWTDCCGDISSLSWTGEDTFICGATAHSDYHNMQYNKPGNLLVGSSSLDTLRSIPDHRIIRPVISKDENAENALPAMRQTQDPWLYTSVVSTAHSNTSGYTFTASFDKTVKVWRVSPDGSSMVLYANWIHDGNVNFVVTSDQHNYVATASDVSTSAIRVYNFEEGLDAAATNYVTYDCDRVASAIPDPLKQEKWAYFPATIAWGKSPSVVNLLLVGYSPRSLTSDEADIPEDKRNSGELCLWDVTDIERGPVLISSAKTQNVFEVIWHPTQPIFIAATSPAGTYEPDVKTQIRLFAQNEFGTFNQLTALDCRASDVNELTIMPNSSVESYVTASCTDGNTYVWDTAHGDKPIHILGHGDSLDNPQHDIPVEDGDTGVKFAVWGKTADRFYTGSSDGKVKAWDLRSPRGEAYVRTVLEVSGGVSVGAFSKDFSKLLIGDATGKVHILAIDEDDEEAIEERAVPKAKGFAATISARARRKIPKVIKHHPEPDPPAGYEENLEKEVEESGRDIARDHLEEGRLQLHPDPLIGVVQGPNYVETGYFRSEAHEMQDSTLPLLSEFQVQQRDVLRTYKEETSFPIVARVQWSDPAVHARNTTLDYELSQLSLMPELTSNQRQYGIDLNYDDHDLDFELLPAQRIFRTEAHDKKRRPFSFRASVASESFHGSVASEEA